MLKVLCYIGAMIGFLAYLPGVPRELRLLQLLFLLLLVPSCVSWLQRRRSNVIKSPAPQLPLPPASGGMPAFLIRFFASQILCMIAPKMIAQQFRHLVGDARASIRAIDDAENYAQPIAFRLPFDAPANGFYWYVYNGGVDRTTSHSWDLVGQRFAYDFVVVDAQGKRWRKDGGTFDDYLCYGVPILAPADGEVIAIVDDVRDAPGVGTGWLDVFTPHFPGCTVTLRH